MKGLIAVRDSLKRIYAEYDFILRPVVRFLLCLLCLILLRNRIGVSEPVCRPVILLVLALLAAVFPAGFISLECVAFVLANMFRTSLSMFLLGCLLFLFTVFLYFGFRPGKGVLIILIPLGFMLKIPYVFPVVLGLSCGISAIVPVCIGVIAWNVISYFSAGLGSFVYSSNIETIISEFIAILKDVFTERSMYVTLIAFTVCILLVHILSRININHSRIIGVLAGAAGLAAVRIIGFHLTGTEFRILSELVSFAAAAVIAVFYGLIFYAVDYKATEHLQFEDDDYYYYVKAVPKISGSMTERKE